MFISLHNYVTHKVAETLFAKYIELNYSYLIKFYARFNQFTTHTKQSLNLKTKTTPNVVEMKLIVILKLRQLCSLSNGGT